MLIRVECRDNGKGWPLMFVSPPIRQNGDGIRINNFAIDRYHDLKKFCDTQRQFTKDAMEGRVHKTPTTFAEILYSSIAGESFKDTVARAVQEELKRRGISD